MAFAIVDVFGERSLSGNPLAVVDLTGGESVEDAWLAAVAREFNQAETTFVLPGTDTADRVLRSFTMGGVEVYGAGHNALGAWWWLLDSGRVAAPGRDLVQRIGDADLAVEVHADGWLAMRQRTPRFGATGDAGEVAAALGLEAGDVRDVPAPRTVDTGAGHLMVVARERAVLGRAVPDGARLVSVAEKAGAEGVYLAWADPEAPVAHARFFNPGAGLPEDAATGTAAGPLAVHLRDTDLLDAGAALTVYQGEDMGRPSTLRLTLGDNGAPVLAGRGFTTMEGRLRLG